MQVAAEPEQVLQVPAQAAQSDPSLKKPFAHAVQTTWFDSFFEHVEAHLLGHSK